MDHPVTEYAEKVVRGEILAGEYVIAACQRHIKDLKRSSIFFDPDAADYIFDYFRIVLRLSVGEWDGKPFELLPWEQFVVGSLFGWHKSDDGYRRFRKAYVETAKGSGKSPVAAGIGVFGLTADKEPGAIILFCATTSEQALSSYRPAVEMVRQSPDLSDRLDVVGGKDPYNIANHAGSSYARRISSTRGYGRSGPIIHMVICDEYHEHRTDHLLNTLGLGVKNRRNPLVLIITNAGILGANPCKKEHDRAIRVVTGQIKNDDYFAFVCGLDKGDDIYDESCWIKANPSLPALPTYQYIRSQLRDSEGMPSLRSTVERWCFCKWTDASSPWLSREVWRKVEVPMIDEEEIKKAPCYLSLDLALRSDLIGAGAIWRVTRTIEGEDLSVLIVRSFAWKPADTVETHQQRDSLPYREWADEGHLILVPGSIVPMAFIGKWVNDMLLAYNVQGLAYDPWRIRTLMETLEQMGIETTIKPTHPGLLMALHPQGFIAGSRKVKDAEDSKEDDPIPLWMPQSIELVEEALLTKTIEIEFNAALSSAALGAVTKSDESDNRRLDKKKSTAKIDPMVALTMAVGFARSGVEERHSLGDIMDHYDSFNQWQDFEP